MFQSLKKLLGIKLKNTRNPFKMTDEQTEDVAKLVCDITPSRPVLGSDADFKMIADAQTAGRGMRAYCQDPNSMNAPKVMQIKTFNPFAMADQKDVQKAAEDLYRSVYGPIKPD